MYKLLFIFLIFSVPYADCMDSFLKHEFDELIKEPCNAFDNPSTFYDTCVDLFKKGLSFKTVIPQIYKNNDQKITTHYDIEIMLRQHILSLAAYNKAHTMHNKAVECFLLCCKDYQKKIKKIIPKPIKIEIIKETCEINTILFSLKDQNQKIDFITNDKLPEPHLSAEKLFNKKDNDVKGILENDYKAKILNGSAYLRPFDMIRLHVPYLKWNKELYWKEHPNDKPERLKIKTNFYALMQKIETLNDLVDPASWEREPLFSSKKINEYTQQLIKENEKWMTSL